MDTSVENYIKGLIKILPSSYQINVNSYQLVKFYRLLSQNDLSMFRKHNQLIVLCTGNNPTQLIICVIFKQILGSHVKAYWEDLSVPKLGWENNFFKNFGFIRRSRLEKTKYTQPTLFYLPFCPFWVYFDIVLGNLSNLKYLTFLGNNFIQIWTDNYISFYLEKNKLTKKELDKVWYNIIKIVVVNKTQLYDIPYKTVFKTNIDMSIPTPMEID